MRPPAGTGSPSVPSPRWRPTREQIAAAVNARVPDVIAPGLAVLFCGINPGLYSGAVGHHFARPGNRFWRTLLDAGFTRRLLSPFEERVLLRSGLGITNLVDRATARADELDADELRTGADHLRGKLGQARPVFLGFLGLSAYRTAFRRPAAGVGPQPERIGQTRVWLLPNPSGLNAHYPPDELVRTFRALRRAASTTDGVSRLSWRHHR